MSKGLLILIGGAEDKKYEKLVLSNVVNLTKARTISVITSASSRPAELFDSYYVAFRELDVRNIHHFDIRYQEETSKAEHFSMLNTSELVFFSGGDQCNLLKIFENTELFKTINEKFHNGKLHIAGTSAGAAASGNPMIYDGDNVGLKKETVGFAQGFGFLNNYIVDTHFMNRNRLPRLAQSLCSGIATKGFGIDEDTAIIVNPDYHCKVIGSGSVTFLESENIYNNTFHSIKKNENISFSGMKLSVFAQGSTFNLQQNKIIKPKKRLFRVIKDVVTPNKHYVKSV